MVQLGDNGKLNWSKLCYPDGDFGNTTKDRTIFVTGNMKKADRT